MGGPYERRSSFDAGTWFEALRNHVQSAQVGKAQRQQSLMDLRQELQSQQNEGLKKVENSMIAFVPIFGHAVDAMLGVVTEFEQQLRGEIGAMQEALHAVDSSQCSETVKALRLGSEAPPSDSPWPSVILEGVEILDALVAAARSDIGNSSGEKQQISENKRAALLQAVKEVRHYADAVVNEVVNRVSRLEMALRRTLASAPHDSATSPAAFRSRERSRSPDLASPPNCEGPASAGCGCSGPPPRTPRQQLLLASQQQQPQQQPSPQLGVMPMQQSFVVAPPPQRPRSRSPSDDTTSPNASSCRSFVRSNRPGDDPRMLRLVVPIGAPVAYQQQVPGSATVNALACAQPQMLLPAAPSRDQGVAGLIQVVPPAACGGAMREDSGGKLRAQRNSIAQTVSPFAQTPPSAASMTVPVGPPAALAPAQHPVAPAVPSRLIAVAPQRGSAQLPAGGCCPQEPQPQRQPFCRGTSCTPVTPPAAPATGTITPRRNSPAASPPPPPGRSLDPSRIQVTSRGAETGSSRESTLGPTRACSPAMAGPQQPRNGFVGEATANALRGATPPGPLASGGSPPFAALRSASPAAAGRTASQVTAAPSNKTPEAGATGISGYFELPMVQMLFGEAAAPDGTDMSGRGHSPVRPILANADNRGGERVGR